MDTANLKQQIIQKALADPGFKASLLADPIAAITALTGLQPPAGAEVVVMEESPNRVCLVLPFTPTPGELTGEELQGVAGGGFFDWGWHEIVLVSTFSLAVGCAVAATVEKCGG